MSNQDRDSDTATAIPRRYYRDDGYVEEELKHIFGQTWLFVGHESEIPSQGDYVTRTMGADPVIISRSEGGEVHVMLNSCAHRGTQLPSLSTWCEAGRRYCNYTPRVRGRPTRP